MPTYQYACTACDHAFDQVQSFSDDALTVCPACSGRLRKIFNAVGVVFKGSGFYRTDSRSSSSATDSGSGSKGEGSKGDGAKSDGSKGDGAKSEGSKSKSESPSASAPATAASGS